MVRYSQQCRHQRHKRVRDFGKHLSQSGKRQGRESETESKPQNGIVPVGPDGKQALGLARP